MKIAVLGTGTMGSAMGGAFAAAGHEVTFGARRPEGVEGMVAPVTDLASAAAAGEVVLNALAAPAGLEVLTGLAQELEGGVLIDVANAAGEDGTLAFTTGSFAGRVQSALPTTRVVKTLNTVPAPLASDPAALPEPTLVFLSGDDAEAKEIVAGLLADIGWTADQQIDLGGIETAIGPEHYFLLYGAVASLFDWQPFNIRRVTP